MNNRDFYGTEFYSFCQHEYDKARVHLKNCGKPNDDYDRFLYLQDEIKKRKNEAKNDDKL